MNFLRERLNSIHVPRRLVNAHKTTVVGHASNDNTEPRCENATGKKGDVEKFNARLPAQVPASSVAKISPMAPEGRSVKDAVPKPMKTGRVE